MGVPGTNPLPSDPEQRLRMKEGTIENGKLLAEAAEQFLKHLADAEEGTGYLREWARVRVRVMHEFEAAGLPQQLAYRAAVDFGDPTLLVVKSLEKGTHA